LQRQVFEVLLPSARDDNAEIRYLALKRHCGAQNQIATLSPSESPDYQ
jgi:hypothetical protein